MEEKNIYIKNVLIGVVVSFLATMILFLIFAGILANTSVSEDIINPSIIVLSSVSIFFGAGIASKKVQKKGIIIGAIVGAVYIFLMYILSSILSRDFSLNLYSSIMIFASILMGGIGGIFGVNLN